MSNLFAKVEQEAFRAGITPRTKQSRDWFRSKLSSMGKVSRNTLMRDEQLKLVNKSQPLIGSMNMFFYDPKHKDTSRNVKIINMISTSRMTTIGDN